MKIEIDNCYNCDCKDLMLAMKNQGIKADWCITDPPYGIGYNKMTGGGENICKRKSYEYKEWDRKRISQEQFDLIFSISKNQIIFGGNYYTDILPPTKSWVVWDKLCKNNWHTDFADGEIAWASKGQVRIFRYMYAGLIQDDMKNKDYRFHPTQKPTQLWIMLLNYYTKEGDLILDPFTGSQSLRIACHKLKRHYIGAELDKEYFEKGTEWFNTITAQLSIFDL